MGKEVVSDADQLSFEQLVEKIMSDGGFYATTECMGKTNDDQKAKLILK